MAINSHKDLIVWQIEYGSRGRRICAHGYVSSTETYRITSQLTRSAVSVPANIAEGKARTTRKDFGHFLAIAQGSLAESETYVLLAIRLKYVSEGQAARILGLIEEIGKMLTTLRARIRANT